jgi:hypothetical protein
MAASDLEVLPIRKNVSLLLKKIALGPEALDCG